MTTTAKTLTLVSLFLAFALGGCAATHPAATAKERAEPIACIPVQTPTVLGDLLGAPAAPGAPQTKTEPAVVTARETSKPVEADFRPQLIVNFAFDSFLLDEAAKKSLEQYYLSVKGKPVPLTLEGFCDERGDGEYNMGLADHRSTAVRSYLSKLGLDPESLAAVGYGSEYPVNKAHNEEAWKLNRRVELVLPGAPKPGSKKRYGTQE
jgi:peptidoglycan-associated lipoprotein